MNIARISLDEVSRLGTGLKRPECVACTQSGEIWVSHALPGGGGGVARLEADGSLHPVVADDGAPEDFMPNGWCMEPGGSFLMSNLGNSGGVWRLHRDGRCEPVLRELHGQPMAPVNFVHRDEAGRVWVSVSTWRFPRERAFHRDVADGTVILLDDNGARIVADGLGYTNEVKVDPSGAYLYAHETLARALSRFALIERDGMLALGPREVVVSYMDGIIPDGFEFDAAGGIWCTSVMSNQLVRVTPDGRQTVVLEDYDPDDIARGMNHWRSGCFGRKDMDIGSARTLASLASITFGGPDLRTGYLGSLFGDCLFTFESPVAGAVPPHWHF